MASSMKSDELPVTVNDSLKRQEQPKGSAAMTKRGVYAAASYMASAVLLVMFNKAALSSYSFPCANVITLFQMFCSCSILYALRCWKIISFTVGEPQTTSNNPTTLVPLKTLVHTLPLALSYLLYMLITMEAVRGINVPMYTTLRRTTVAFTMIVEYLLTGQKHSLPVVGSVGIILLGAFLAGAWDLSFDAYGYAVVFIANICTAAYLAFISRIGRSSGLSSFGLMWCNGIICTPILLFWTSFRGDLEVTMNFPLLFYPGFQVVMLLSCIMAFLINYYVFLNTTLNSALTQTICGNLKDLLTIGLGWLLFGGLPFDLFNIVGQALGFLGSCFYAYCKLQGK
ncbi:UDP-N-acetylglucosamine transporter UGNT1 [Citrus sinensis]|uniref:UDP-N-acetylglucosamine transporter UGNT1-like isoform X1 n=1 Tax=Citrus sinensis TaxID=2711 RepID=UPI0003D784C2|nr:UDP-N-acetylglucosamine transporter UGNT1-like isoform X1 [Citrus sinensis]XP_024953265.1 UDP-N-acetylglucosamine transporter UGNT1-like isoform X1 [Citrus sinensis]XP_024953266.1 UDP-N-acetylglucosamine transporter UGNT1-like isoform X1 [Citrus sinensis]XP_052289756.1 UDP-N-acetylglucosamine transporter UGNT1-like isoform X1 [Citrus sinensis]KAH9653299.1 UDP-N-acetylglucosamine transporter UGNT1 [Citrus sinensis]